MVYPKQTSEDRNQLSGFEPKEMFRQPRYFPARNTAIILKLAHPFKTPRGPTVSLLFAGAGTPRRLVEPLPSSRTSGSDTPWRFPTLPRDHLSATENSRRSPPWTRQKDRRQPF